MLTCKGYDFVIWWQMMEASRIMDEHDAQLLSFCVVTLLETLFGKSAQVLALKPARKDKMASYNVNLSKLFNVWTRKMKMSSSLIKR